MRARPSKRSTAKGANILAERIAAVRDDCHRTLEVLSNGRRSSESKLAECARLGDSLAATQDFLKSTVARIVISGIKRQNGGTD